MLTRNCRWCQLQNEALNEHFGTCRRKMILRTKGNEIWKFLFRFLWKVYHKQSMNRCIHQPFHESFAFKCCQILLSLDMIRWVILTPYLRYKPTVLFD